ncbi:hypothetical protein KIPB_003271 [Kipferlia bialata]|uniref:Uncharacterized protein n=1 Tax=Kipferlia bialata TaxID=797122 RepID=A0A391NQ51_9EUKA|nr:hypothetical protein KIPB_003271 [Kipferlia bialata]|eukprot:g3271.t1
MGSCVVGSDPGTGVPCLKRWRKDIRSWETVRDPDGDSVCDRMTKGVVKGDTVFYVDRDGDGKITLCGYRARDFPFNICDLPGAPRFSLPLTATSRHIIVPIVEEKHDDLNLVTMLSYGLVTGEWERLGEVRGPSGFHSIHMIGETTALSFGYDQGEDTDYVSFLDLELPGGDDYISACDFEMI